MKTVISLLVGLMISFGVHAEQTKDLFKMSFYVTDKDSITFYSPVALGVPGCPNAKYFRVYKRPLVQSAAISSHLSGHRLGGSGSCRKSTKKIWYFLVDAVWSKE